MPGFFLRLGSEVTGPHEAAALRAMAARGELHGEHEVSRDGRAWRRLRDVRGFSALEPAGEPVDAPGSAAPDADPITLAEVAAPVWAVLRRAGKVAAKAAGRAASAAADAVRDSARRASAARQQSEADRVRIAADAALARAAAASMARGPTETVRWQLETSVRFPRLVTLSDGSRTRHGKPLLDVEYAMDGLSARIVRAELVRTAADPDDDHPTEGEPNMEADPSGDLFRYVGELDAHDLLDAARHELETNEAFAWRLRERWYVMRQFHRAGGSRTRD